MKKLQVALDLFSEEKALEVLSKIGDYIDIIELGTPLMIAEGCRVIKSVKNKYPEKIVFADIKVMDGGNVIPRLAYEAGADMVSVLAVAEDQTIAATLKCAEEFNKAVLVDMCSVSDMALRGSQVDAMNPDYVCVHVGYDIQATGVDPVQELKKIKSIKAKKAIAGGIKLENFEAAVNSDADVIIVGGGLYNQDDISTVAKEMRTILDKYNFNKEGNND